MGSTQAPTDMRAIIKGGVEFSKSDLAQLGIAKRMQNEFKLVPATSMFQRKQAAFRERLGQEVELVNAEVKNYAAHGDKVIIPRIRGIQIANEQGIELVDDSSAGRALPHIKDTIQPRTEEQARFFSTIISCLERSGACLAVAQTGTGKTVAALKVVANFASTTLVIVPNTSLQMQWINEAKDKLGIPEDRIGTVGGGKSNWKGKDFVVGVINSVSKMKDEEFARQFGIAIWDEAHRVPAATFSKSLLAVQAEYMLALSATPERGDGMSALLYQWFGLAGATATAKTLPLIYKTINYSEPRHGKWDDALRGNIMTFPTVTSLLSKDISRNQLIVDFALNAIEANHFALVITDRVDHAHELKRMMVESKQLFEDEVVCFTGKTKAEEKERAKNDPTVKAICATFGSMKEGVDIPRLSFGIDATPKGKATQACGRIRRECAGKKDPVWVSIVDHRIGEAVQLLRARTRDLSKTGGSVKIQHIGSYDNY